MKYLWRVLLFCMLLLPVSLLLALFTEQGSEGLLAAVVRLAPLEIEYGSGTFSGRLHLRRVRYQTDGLRVQLDDVVAAIAPACLWRSALCFRQLQAAHLDIALLPGSEDEQDPQDASPRDRDAPLIVFPLPLETDALLLESIRIQWQSGEWRQGPAQGQVRLGGSTIEVIDAVLTRPHLELRESVEVAEVLATRVLSRIDLPLELIVTRARLEQPSWDFYGTGNQCQEIELQGSWTNTRLQLSRLAVDGGDLGQLALRGELAFSNDWPLQVDVDVSLGQPPLWAGLHGRPLDLSVTGTLASMAWQLTTAGAPELSAEGQVNVLDRQLPFSVTLWATSPDNLLLADLAGVPAALSDLQLEFPLTLAASGTLSAQQFELQGAVSGMGYESLQVSLAGGHEQDMIIIDTFSARDPAGANDLYGSGNISLGESLQWNLLLETSGLALPNVSEYAFGRLTGKLRLNGWAQDEDWRLDVVDVELHGDINELPARINGFAGVGSSMQLTRSQLEAELNGARLSLRSSGDAGAPGHIEVSVDDLGRWQSGSRGKLQVQAVLGADRQHFQLRGSVQDVQWQGLEVGSGNISGRYLAQAGHTFNLDTKLQDVVMGGLQLSSLRLSVDGTDSRQSLSVVSQGDLGGELAVTGFLQDGQWAGSLAPTSLHTPYGVWQLTESVALSWSNSAQQLALGGHCWIQQRTRVCPGDMLLGQAGSGSLEVDGDMALLAGQLSPGVDLQGELQLQLEGRWAPDSGIFAQGRAQTKAVSLTRHHGEGESASIGWDGGDVVFGYDNDGLKLDWQLQREGRKVLGLALLLPPDRAAPLSGTASFESLQLDTLAAFVPALSRLEGDINGQLRLAGTVDQPLAHGILQLSGGHLTMVGNPTELDGLDLTLNMHGDWAQVRGSGRLGGGQLQIAGELKTQPQWYLELLLEGDKHNLLYPPSTEGLVSQKLRVELSAGLLDLSGEITVHEGQLEFEQLPAGSVAVSADVVEVDYAGNVIREELPFDIHMDVQVAIEDRFKVTGSILDATLGGNLHLQQQSGRPLRLFGDLHTVTGKLRAYQQQLQIERGSISFSGSPGNPLIDVRAQREISNSNVTVGVQVRGRLEEDLILDIYSDPAMSQGEAMSYLVRGRGLDAGAGADGTAVALSLASGAVNRSTLVSELNRIPGVSNIEFGASGAEGDTAATVSGYIGGRIYLSYGLGLYEPINVLTTRLYLRPRLWLEVVSSLENSVDLYYSFDID